MRSTGKRPNQHYFACGCPAKIIVAIDRTAEEGIVLRVNSVEIGHNHELSAKRYAFYPKIRRLSTGERDDAKKLLRLRVKPSDVKATICETTNKLVQTKDIFNIVSGKRDVFD